jgi:7-cyano-7-deazaguanine reductase
MSYDFKALGKDMSQPSKDLEVFPTPEHVQLVRFTSDEVTSFCPVTGQPDFNKVEIEFKPDKWCVESKSLKLYLWTFRDEAIFGEGLASEIAKDIAAALDPFYCRVTLHQSVRGGIQMTAVAEVHRDEQAGDD